MMSNYYEYGYDMIEDHDSIIVHSSLDSAVLSSTFGQDFGVMANRKIFSGDGAELSDDEINKELNKFAGQDFKELLKLVNCVGEHYFAKGYDASFVDVFQVITKFELESL